MFTNANESSCLNSCVTQRLLRYEEYENNKKKRECKGKKARKKKRRVGENMHKNFLNRTVNDVPYSVVTILCFIDCGLFPAGGPVIWSVRRQISKMNPVCHLLPDKTEGDI